MKIQFESQMHRQRLVLGVLCGLLPICCILFGLFGLDGNLPNWWYSISATYYANSKMWMIGLLTLTSFFFATYQGYDAGDKVHTIISAITSICVVIFPCETPGIPGRVGLFMLPVGVSKIAHGLAAGILFASFASMILTQFTKGSDKKRNRVYIICGVIIILFVVLLALNSVFALPEWMVIVDEFVMLEAFAVAWIVKSKAIILA